MGYVWRGHDQTFARIAIVNEWLAKRFNTTHRAILTIEIGVVAGFGFTMMQIGEHLVAIMIWLLLCALWISKIFPGDLDLKNHGLAILEKVLQTFAALAICAVLIVITDVRRGNDPWSNLMKLWIRQPVHRHTLSPSERTLFEKPLQGAQEPPWHVQIGCPAVDEQACAFATQFQSFFGEAGWDVEGSVIRENLGRPMQGVVLVQRGGTEYGSTHWKWDQGGNSEFTQSYENLYQAFSNIGIEPAGNVSPDQPEHTLIVYFGPAKEDESEPTQLSKHLAVIRKLRAEGLLPAPGQTPTPKMLEYMRENHEIRVP